MEALGFGRRCVSTLCCLTLLCAHASALAQSTSDATTPPPTPTASNVASPLAARAPAPEAAPPAAPAPSAGHASRLPAFIALGVGGLAVGGAVITGIIANADYNDAKSSCSPACSDSQLSPGRTLALTSTFLTGVAIVGLGVGVTLLLTSGPDPAQVSLAPRVRLTGAAGAARADATWRF
jgi:hypothetical protein